MSWLRTVHAHQHHFGWDNSLPPVLRIAPGEEVAFEVLDASGGQLGPDSGPEAVARLDFSRVNPVTGPVYVEGAEPGDALSVEVLGLEGSGWGWTAIIPGFGLLAEDFPEPYLHISRYDSKGVEFLPGIVLPFRPFPGTIGVAPREPGVHSVVPPREVGGNLDIRDLVEGARLFLPVQVEGALFSVGDTHAAQGDGEVCGTAVESPMRIALRFSLKKDARLPFPYFETPSAGPRDLSERGYLATTGIGPDLLKATKEAVRYMVDLLAKEYGFSPELAYMLCSVACDLKVSEVVDAPNWVVSAYLPRKILP